MLDRLTFPFPAELHRLDARAIAPDRDEDFKETVRVDSDDGLAEAARCQHPPVRVPCQVEAEDFQALRTGTPGNTPRRRTFAEKFGTSSTHGKVARWAPPPPAPRRAPWTA